MSEHLDALRANVANTAAPAPELASYLEQVRTRAYTVTDADVERLKAAGVSEDVIFEQTVAAAISEGLRRLDAAPGAEEVTGVQVDSRRIAPGDLFAAVGGGAEFLDDALARGAAATLVPEEPFAAFAALGSAVRDRSSARVVGITGSTGKTSTKDILAALCAPAARTVATEANFNNEIGVPLTLCRLEHDTEICILELAMRGLGQIAELCAIARPDVGVAVVRAAREAAALRAAIDAAL